MLALDQAAEVIASPPLAPGDHPIDLHHLARMTLGERSLEREVLSLFNRQAEILLVRISQAAPPVVAAAAHTLKGSATGIGAWRVASAAQTVERAQPGDLGAAVAMLTAAIQEARTAIAALLRT